MSFKKYLKDTINFLLFYSLLMTFIILIIYFDRKNRVLPSSLLYIIFVSIVMLIIYISIDFFAKYQHIKKLLQIEALKDKTPILPKPIDYKDEVYSLIIGNLYEYFIETTKNIDTEFKENKDFITSWVHEIKTPITTSKLLIDSNNPNSTEKTLESLEEEIEKINDYVEKVLYYSRSDNFSKDYMISEVTIDKLIKESVKKHSILFIKKHFKLTTHVPVSFTVYTDKKWLLFIIDQLLSNALKYTNKGGSIVFSSFENDKEKLLIIEDNGTGIKSQDLNKIFSKAFTGYNGRNANLKATGLGLYLSQKLAKKLGHYITLESEYGKGTKAIIHFPKWDDFYDVTLM